MKQLSLSALFAAAFAGPILTLSAAVPAPDQLLPADTLAVFTAPDCAKLAAARQETPALQLWNDASFRPFREKLMNKVTQDVLGPLERQLGIKLADYADMAQGQFTLAITQHGWTGGKDPLPAMLLLVDARDKVDLLKKNLEEVRKKLSDSGKQFKINKIRDVEFTTVRMDTGAGDPPAGGKEKDEGGAKSGGSGAPVLEVSFGQVGSLLLVGSEPKDLEKVLIRLSGGSVPCLAEQPVFEADHRALFREALVYGWVHFAPLGEIITKLAVESASGAPNPAVPKPEVAISAVGLSSLKTLAFSAKRNVEGEWVDLSLGVPEDKRKGVFKLLATESKDSGVPAFVPAEAVQFSRWRADGQKFWASIEAMVNEISPGSMGFVLTQLETAMREKNPDFDFRKSLVANLGDDLMTYQKAPRGKTLEEFNAAPSLFLLGSPNAEQLLQSLRSLLAMIPGPMMGTEAKEREFLGKKIYSLPLPTVGAAKERSLSFTASGGYLVMGNDAAMVEEYLRSGDAKPKALREAPGLTEAMQKIGGAAGGLFGYQNDTETMRALFETLKADPAALDNLLAQTPIKPQIGDQKLVIKEWLDFSLLPAFDQVAKYFYMTVYSGRMTPSGFNLRVFSPTPPQMK